MVIDVQKMLYPFKAINYIIKEVIVRVRIRIAVVCMPLTLGSELHLARLRSPLNENYFEKLLVT